MTTNLTSMHQQVKEALVTTFWQLEHDGDTMFDVLATVALDAAADAINGALDSAVDRTFASMDRSSMLRLIADSLDQPPNERETR